MLSPVIRFERVSKRFRRDGGCESLADLIKRGLRLFAPAQANAEIANSFWALREVDFEVHRGGSMGIVGPNGAGKSTALKLLARILKPDAGVVDVRGRVTALIEVGAGFHGELTGRENVFLNGAILGMTRREIRQKLDAIVSFAGVEAFLDMPVKRYSSGMYARLGFSIAAHVDPDVLLVDEVLSVGDAVFRLRCLDRMKSLIQQGATLVFVTHQLEQMQAICDRALVLDGGACTFIGRTQDAVDHYLRAMTNTWIQRPTDLAHEAVESDPVCRIDCVRMLDQHDRETVRLGMRESLRIEIHLALTRTIENLVVELNLRGTAHEHLLSLNSARSEQTFRVAAGEQLVALSLPEIPIAGGQYFWNVRVWDGHRGVTLVDTPFRYPMIVDDGGRATGALCLDHEWSYAAQTVSKPLTQIEGKSIDRSILTNERALRSAENRSGESGEVNSCEHLLTST